MNKVKVFSRDNMLEFVTVTPTIRTIPHQDQLLLFIIPETMRHVHVQQWFTRTYMYNKYIELSDQPRAQLSKKMMLLSTLHMTRID